MTEEELIGKLEMIQRMKSESNILELKSAEKGCPQHLYDSLSSFSNFSYAPCSIITAYGKNGFCSVSFLFSSTDRPFFVSHSMPYIMSIPFCSRYSLNAAGSSMVFPSLNRTNSFSSSDFFPIHSFLIRSSSLIFPSRRSRICSFRFRLSSGS